METKSNHIAVSEWTEKFVKCLDALHNAHKLMRQTAKDYMSQNGVVSESDYNDCYGDMEQSFCNLEKMIRDDVTSTIDRNLHDHYVDSDDPISEI